MPATFNREIPGSSAGGRTNADLAQLVAQLTCNQWVVGSIPTVGTIWPHRQAVKTRPFHGRFPGSNPGGVTIKIFNYTNEVL